MLGAPGLIEAWRRGNVAIANAPGTGVADDKVIYPYVPAMIRYYLGEEPLMDNVPTYDLTDAQQQAHVVANIDRMVLKPVDASGGYGIHFGRLMSSRDRSEFLDGVKANPRQWLAQEEVALSRAVCLRAGGGFEPRAVDLRPFVLLDERPWIVPGGLTRVAGDPDELVVNSSHGGGSKDTWVSDTLTYSVSHRTVLRYTAKVSLSYNEVRMRPRDRGSQRTLAFSLLSKPWAVPRSRVDYFGNFVHRLDVTTPHQTARVHRRRRGREHRTAPPETARNGTRTRLPATRVSSSCCRARASRSARTRGRSGTSGTVMTPASTVSSRPRSASAASSVTSAGRPPSNRASTISWKGAPVSARTSRISSWRWCAAPAGPRDT